VLNRLARNMTILVWPEHVWIGGEWAMLGPRRRTHLDWWITGSAGPKLIMGHAWA
jgi:hypothetical protein